MRWPPIWNIMDINSRCLKSPPKSTLLKALSTPQNIHIYTGHRKKNPKPQKSFDNHSFSGRPDKDTFFIFGHTPSTCSMWSNSLWIYCPWIYHTSFCKRLFSPWSTSQNNRYHMLAIYHINKRLDFINPPQKKLSLMEFHLIRQYIFF